MDWGSSCQAVRHSYKQPATGASPPILLIPLQCEKPNKKRNIYIFALGKTLNSTVREKWDCLRLLLHDWVNEMNACLEGGQWGVYNVGLTENTRTSKHTHTHTHTISISTCWKTAIFRLFFSLQGCLKWIYKHIGIILLSSGDTLACFWLWRHFRYWQVLLLWGSHPYSWYAMYKTICELIWDLGLELFELYKPRKLIPCFMTHNKITDNNRQ